MLKTHGVLHFSLPVTDLDRSRKFYEQLLGMKVVEQSPRMVFLQTGDDYLILAKGNEPLKYDSAKSTSVHHGVSGAYRNEENVGEDERVRRLDGYSIAGKNSLFLDSRPIGLHNQLKFDFVQLLIMKRHVILAALQFKRVRVEIVRMCRIDRVLHGLKPIAAQHFADIDLFETVGPH